jgi:hypothetical protein
VTTKVTLSASGATGGIGGAVNVTFNNPGGAPYIVAIPLSGLSIALPAFPGLTELLAALCHDPGTGPGLHPDCCCCCYCWKHICCWDPCCCRYVWRWVQYPCCHPHHPRSYDDDSYDEASALVDPANGVRMVQHWSDSSGNAHQQFVTVSRDFAARWGYSPISAARSTTRIARQVASIDRPTIAPDAERTVNMTEHWTDEYGQTQQRTVYVTEQFAARHGYKPGDDQRGDHLVSASLAKTLD